MMNYTQTDKFVDYVFQFENEEISEKIKEEAKLCILDYLGVAFAGAKLCGSSLTPYISNCERGSSTIIGYGERVSLQNAAFINGFTAHSTELDDGQRTGQIHLGAVIMPALLAVADAKELSGENIIRGICAGYEAAILLSSTMQPSHRAQGYHTTGTCGTIGAAIGIAVALSFSKKQIKTVLSSAVTSASGILEILEDSSELKPYNCARAAMDGLTAGMMGFTELTSPNDILSGDRGLFSVMSDNNKPIINYNVDGAYAIMTIYRKIHASCRHTHPAIEAILELRRENEIEIPDIKSIVVYTYHEGIKGHNHTIISGQESAKMSVPYAVAVALLNQNVGIDAFSDELIHNTELQNLIHKITINEDENLTRMSRLHRGSRVEIHMNNGVKHVKQVDYPLGEPENPLGKEGIIRKYKSLMTYSNIDNELVENILNAVENIELDSRNLFRLLSREQIIDG